MWFRGKELPPRGSVQDLVAIELLRRERHEKLVQWEATVKAIGYFLGHSRDAVYNILGPLREQVQEAVDQTIFDVGAMRQKLAGYLSQIQSRNQEHQQRMEQLDMLSAMAESHNAT